MNKRETYAYLDQAGVAYEVTELVGPAEAIAQKVGDAIDLVGVIICGDNFSGQIEDAAKAFIAQVIEEQKPEIFVSGPAFNAGRYGFACAGACKVAHEAGVTCVSGMYEENPGLERCQSFAWVAKTANAAAKMRKAVPVMANLVAKICGGRGSHPRRRWLFCPRSPRVRARGRARLHPRGQHADRPHDQAGR